MTTKHLTAGDVVRTVFGDQGTVVRVRKHHPYAKNGVRSVEFLRHPGTPTCSLSKYGSCAESDITEVTKRF